MNTYVLDASVVAAAFFTETHAEIARKLLGSHHELLAPDLLHAEIANVAWKRVQRGEMDDAEATDLLSDMMRLPILIVPGSQLIHSALQIALHTKRTVYDSLYVAAAIQSNAVLITVDKRLVNALRRTPLESYLQWIGEDAPGI